MLSVTTRAILLAGVADATKAALDAIERRQTFAAGDVIFRQGEPSQALVTVVSGIVKVWRTAEDGTAITLALLGPGEPIGTLHAARDMPNSASVSAHTRTELTVWPLDGLRRIMADDAVLAANALNIIARYAVRMIERLEEVTTAPVEQRVARALCRVSGLAKPGSLIADLPLSRQDVADLSATTLPTTSRIMARWRSEGLIGGHRGRIHLLDLNRLRAIADFPPENDVLEIPAPAP